MIEPGKVWLVGAGPGEPELITVKGRELLERATVVLYDALAHEGLLEHCRAEARLVFVGKRAGEHSMSQQEITERLIDFARQGHLVVRLKGGDPYLFARGAEEAEALVDAGIDFGVVPGIASPVGTSACAGFSLTHRDLASSVTFVTGTDKTGKPHSTEEWARFGASADTLCILMGMRRLEEITRALIAGGRAEATPTAVVEWGARAEQRVLVATLGTVAAQVREQGFSNPAIVFVGEVVKLRDKLRFYDRGPLFGKRLLVLRPAEQARQSAKEIRARGAIPLVSPLISIEEPAEPSRVARAVERLSSYDWVLLTSANGAERLIAAIVAIGRDARAFGTAKIGVIGPKTAEPFKRLGIVPDLTAEEYVAEGLLSALASEKPLKRVLLFRAAEARELLPEKLRAQGVEVDVVPAYRTRLLAGAEVEPVRAALAAGSVAAVLVTSSSMARALAQALAEDGPRLLGATRVASIGPVTTATLRSLGLPVDVEATTYTVPGLLDAIEQDLARQQLLCDK